MKRDEHLKSPDFLNAAEFPAITYKSTAVHFEGDTPSSVDGNLTIMCVTRPVTLTIDAFNCGSIPMSKKSECGAGASAQIKRSDFGIKYGLPGIGDDVKLVFEIEAIKNQIGIAMKKAAGSGWFFVLCQVRCFQDEMFQIKQLLFLYI